MSKSLPISVDVIEGEVKEFPIEMYFRTDLIIPIGNDIVRYFDDFMCSVAHKTFYFKYGQDLFGTSQFKSFDDYWQYTSAGVWNGFTLLLDGCALNVDGMELLF